MSKPPWIRIPLAFAAVLPVASYPVLFAYFHNAGEASLSQVWPLLGVFMGFAAGFFLLCSWLARDAEMGALSTNVALVLFAFYQPIEAVIRDLVWPVRYWHLVPALLVGILLLSLRLRGLDVPRRHGVARANRVATSIFALLIVYNFAMALPTLSGKVRLVRQARQSGGVDSVFDPSQSNHFPDVYYILLDEYSSFDMILKHYDYDNSAFADLLEQTGFSISHTSHNPSPSTPEILAHLIGMDPSQVPVGFPQDADGQYAPVANFSKAPYYEIIAQSRLTRFFKEFGYEIHVADMGKLFINHPVTLFSDHAYEPDRTGRMENTHNTLQGVVLSRSALYVLGLRADPNFYNRMVNEIFDWIVLPRNGEKPIFLFAHIMCPHTPFSFDKDGRRISGGFDWHNKAYYLGQYLYVTDRIAGIVRQLVERDPDCVIILQSDHSARRWGHVAVDGNAPGRVEVGARNSLATLPYSDMTSILNAVYYRGLPLDIEGLSGLDTGLTVYNHLFGTGFPSGRSP